MPRKQRFKPSRKPKPMPMVQTQEGAEIDRPDVQLDEAPRSPEPEHREPIPPDRTPRREAAEAS